MIEGLPTCLFRISYGADDDRLHDFYIPALERSIRFDRTTGFFSSAALAIAAAGIVRLIHNGGKMRLLCGAQLSEKDVDAVRKGAELKAVAGEAMAGCLADPTDTSLKARLEALAWMVAKGMLEIRVVLPRGKDGFPLPASEAREYYHPKEGVFEDAAGNKLAFSGSSNDSENGWQWNYEVFSVYASWPLVEGLPPLTPYVAQVEHRFGRLWQGKEDSWIALDIPEAARKRLLKYTPAMAPTVDPLEHRPDDDDETAELVHLPSPEAVAQERLQFQFIREAPFLPNAGMLGVETSAVTPWPHQIRVIQQAIARFPESFLFCDEVGLGKTIEAALALRQLVICGRVRRALLLVPKSVMRQWQEELYEKANLNVPRYEISSVRDVFDNELDWTGDSVWNAFPFMLASSQLMKRRDRQAQLLAASPWDLVIVDEAHHARRRDFLEDRYRPNRLLELLSGTPGNPGIKDRTQCMYLMTATPMQVHPVEVWDLLRVLGLGGRWGATEENFLGFFSELRQPFGQRKWAFLLNMVRDYLETGGELDPTFAESAQRELGFVEWDVVQGLPFSRKKDTTVSTLGGKARAYLHEMVRRHTPLKTMVWRNTRTLLRKYREKGILSDNIPTRNPENVWVPLVEGPGSERELYERIEEYISDFYRKYEAERKGLGFVMTVYRRRLTSSFYALEKSLERRCAFLRGHLKASGLLTDEDLEQDDLDIDISEDEEMSVRARFQEELHYVEDFLHGIKSLGTDSKIERLSKDLRRIFAKRDTVIIFTQYTDTMDYLREHLRGVYGSHVACYSGRGGERWDGAGWVPRPKEDIKTAFRQGDSTDGEIKILLCTEAASEGLNLQTCGVLINYDMPWNPMRVEQRIGRIDRIGQTFDEVWVLNYFYEDTVEAIVYQRLGDRIGWFEDVVGELQPILHRVSRTIQKVAMAGGSERAKRLEEEIQAIRADLDAKSADWLDLDPYIDYDLPSEAGTVPLTLADIERVLTQSHATMSLFGKHPEIPGAYLLTWKDQQRTVTFKRDVFDLHPYSAEFLSYGNPLFAEVIASIDPPTGGDGPDGIGFWKSEGGVAPVSVLLRPGDSADLCETESMACLDAVASGEAPTAEWSPEIAEEAGRYFVRIRSEGLRQFERVWEDRRAGEKLALVEAARQVLVRAALVELAQAQQPDLFEDLPPFEFGTAPVLALRRHGIPFKPLLAKVTGEDGMRAEPTDPFFAEIQGNSAQVLRRRWDALREKGMEILHQYAVLLKSTGGSTLVGQVEGNEHQSWFAVPAHARPKEAPQAQGWKVLSDGEAQPFVNCVPLYDLEAAAGAFGEGQVPERQAWVTTDAGRKILEGMFVAQVVGHSMEPKIPDGAYCLFQHPVTGSRDGRIVLVQHHAINDPDTGGQYTVKRYTSTKQAGPDGSWTHSKVTLHPLNPDYEPIGLGTADEGEVAVVAELVDVIGLKGDK